MLPWAVAIAAAASGVLSPVTAQLTPTSADFGDVPPLGIEGTRREFRLPARGRASDDTLMTALSGPDAGSFTVREMACFEVPGPPHCLLRVMFIPTSYGRKVATLIVSGPGGRLGTATVTGNAVYGCGPLHVSCNYAGNFNGSVVWTEGLNSSNSTGGTTTLSVRGSVEIKAGVASCNGSMSERRVTPRMGESQLSAALTGEGIAIVEFGKGTDDDENQTWYSITVVCPRAGATLTSKNYQTGEVQTTRSSPVPEPARMGHGEVSSYKQADSGQRVILKGSTSDVHPDADPANGTQGVISMAWSLARLDQPVPGPMAPPSGRLPFRAAPERSTWP